LTLSFIVPLPSGAPGTWQSVLAGQAMLEFGEFANQFPVVDECFTHLDEGADRLIVINRFR
jgi:hypothetical protein